MLFLPVALRRLRQNLKRNRAGALSLALCVLAGCASTRNAEPASSPEGPYTLHNDTRKMANVGNVVSTADGTWVWTKVLGLVRTDGDGSLAVSGMKKFDDALLARGLRHLKGKHVF